MRTTCSECLKLKLKSYEVKIAEDRFKQSTSHVPWSKIAMDMTGPILVCSEPDRKVTRNTKTRFTKKYILIVCDTSGTGAVIKWHLPLQLHLLWLYKLILLQLTQ